MMKRVFSSTCGITFSALLALLLTSGCSDPKWPRLSVRRVFSRLFPQPTPEPARPIPSGLDASTKATSDAPLLEAWAKRNMLDAYDRVGVRDPRWDAAVRDFIEKGTAQVMGLRVEVAPKERLRLGERILASGCDDPLVLYLQALALSSYDTHSYEATLLFEKAMAGMVNSSYPRAVARYVASGTFRHYSENFQAEARGGRPRSFEIQWFKSSLSDGSYGPDDQVVLAIQLMTGTGPSFLSRHATDVVAAMRASPWIDQWVVDLAIGSIEKAAAWDARGTKFAAEVTDEGWRGYSEHMRRAKKHLTQAYAKRSDRPEIASLMMSVIQAGAGDGCETTRTWFDRAVAAQMDYMPAYDFMVNDLRPRWGGSYAKLLGFGRECSATNRFDTEVPAILLDAIQQMDWDRQDKNKKEQRLRKPSLFREQQYYSMISQVLDRYLAEKDRAVQAPYWRTLYSIAAFKAGRFEEAYRHLQANGFRSDPIAVARLWDTPEDFVERAAAYAGQSGPDVRRAEELADSGNRAEAIELLRLAEPRTSDEPALRFISHVRATLLIEERLQSREWIPIGPPTSRLEGWEQRQGTWSVEADGSLMGRSDAAGHMIVCSARIGPDFEFRGSLEAVCSDNGYYQAGPLFGDPRPGKSNWMAARCTFSQNGTEQIWLSRRFSGDWKAGLIARTGKHKFLVRRQRKAITIWIDGGPFVANFTPPDNLDQDDRLRVGLGGFIDANRIAVRYRDLAVRLP